MILNLRPTNTEFLEPVVEEIEARFGSGGGSGGGQGGGEEGTNVIDDDDDGKARIQKILEVVRECMGGGEDYAGNGNGNGNDEREREDESMQGVET